MLIKDPINVDIIESQTKMETAMEAVYEEPKQTINEESIKTIDEEPIKTIEEPINKRIDNEFNRERIKQIKKNKCRCCNRQKNGRFDTCCQACINGKHTSDCNKRNEKNLTCVPSQDKFDNPNKSSSLKNKTVDKNIKYPFISKITDKSVTLNDITYTLCEVKVLEHSWIPTSKILTQMWIKYKHNGKKINPRFPGNMDTEIYDTETEYIVELDAIRRVYDNSFYRHNGAYIVSDGPGLVNPGWKVINGEIVQIPRHISDILPTFSTRKWYNFSYLNSKQILEWFKWPHNEYNK